MSILVAYYLSSLFPNFSTVWYQNEGKNYFFKNLKQNQNNEPGAFPSMHSFKMSFVYFLEILFKCAYNWMETQLT